MDGSIRHNCQFEGDTFWDVQPVKADERWGRPLMCLACNSLLSGIVWDCRSFIQCTIVPNLGSNYPNLVTGAFDLGNGLFFIVLDQN